MLRTVRDQGVAGSNPVAPTNYLPENKGPRENDLGPLFLKIAAGSSFGCGSPPGAWRIRLSRRHTWAGTSRFR